MSTFKAIDFNHIRPSIADLGIWGDVRYDTSDAAPDYIGVNATNGEATSESTWKIWKLTYSGSDVTRVQLAYGTWDGRVALFP